MISKEMMEELIKKAEGSAEATKKLEEAVHRLTGRVDTLERENRIIKKENLDIKRANDKIRSQIKVIQRAVNEIGK